MMYIQIFNSCHTDWFIWVIMKHTNSTWMTGACLFHIKAMAADGLVMSRARASAAMVLSYVFRNGPVSPPDFSLNKKKTSKSFWLIKSTLVPFSGQVHSINISFHEFLRLTDTYKYVCQLLMLLHYNPFTQFVLQKRSFVYIIICHLTGSERLSEMLLHHWLLITKQNTKQFPITTIINELQVLYQHSMYVPKPSFCDHLAITDAANHLRYVFLPQ